MKRFLALFLTAVMLLSMLTACNTTDENPASTTAAEITAVATTTSTAEPESVPFNDEKLYVGYGRANVSPVRAGGEFIPLTLGGYPMVRIPNKILSDLFVSCTAMRDAEGDTALVFAADALDVPNDVYTEVIKKLSQELNVPESNIIINANHIHTAPNLEDKSDMNAFNEYKKLFCDGILSAGREAISDLTLCTELYAGTLDGEGLNFIRRYVRAERGQFKHEIEGDHSMPLVRFVREGKKDVILANWAAHCDTVATGDYYAVSSDYIHYIRECVEGELDAHVSVHNAASGDVNPYSRFSEEMKYFSTETYGTAIGRLIVDNISSLSKLEIKSNVESASAVATMTWKNYPTETKEMTVSAVSIGNIAFATAPYEIHSQTGMNIKESSSFELTFVCGYTNGKFGYIPPEYAFANGGYEVESCLYSKGSAELIQNEISKIIKTLYTDVYGEQGE